MLELPNYRLTGQLCVPQHGIHPKKLSEVEEKILRKIRKAKLFIWLRKNRHLLFDEKFQQELAKIYKDSTVGLSPVPPAQLAKRHYLTSLHRSK